MTRTEKQRIEDAISRTSNYLVVVQSNENRKRTIVSSYKGSLEGALIVARDKFRTKFHRTSKNLFYRVQVQVGKRELVVPEEYWRPYRRD